VFLVILGRLPLGFCQKSVERLFVDRPFVVNEFNLIVVYAVGMKCYRIREQNRVVFLMGSQVEQIEKNYSSERCRLSMDFQIVNQNHLKLELLMDEEAYNIFEMRWERFHATDEIFFDFVDFQ
jgi:hypothetical protein